MNYCSRCGRNVVLTTPPGEDRPRFFCPSCGAIHYQNPRVVVGAIPEHGGRILLCRRAIEPCHGKWTLPAGYLENGETLAGCALRETWEEAGARLSALEPYRIFNICHINQVYVMFRGRLEGPDYAPGRESLEVGLFAAGDIPWEAIAFRVIARTLRDYLEDAAGGRAFRFAIADIEPAPL
jgi:ADP-ribose pyrophosphatase YjhB (NUDIX family)